MESIKSSIERLNRSHMRELVHLYKEVFNKSVTEDYFFIKYGFFDPTILNLSHSLLVEGKVVGFFGVRIIKYQRGIETKMIPHTGDYFILDQFRGSGMYQKLYEHVLKELSIANFNIVYAFHSEQTYKISKKWGWKDTRGLQRFHIISTPRILGRIIKTVELDYLQLKRFKKVLSPYVTQLDLSELNRVKNEFSAVYDANFYKSKAFVDHFQVTISRCTAFLKLQGNLSVGFVYFHSDADIPSFIKTLKKIAAQALIHETVIHVQDETIECGLLKKYLSPKPSFKISALTLASSDFPIDSIKLNFMDKDIF